LDQRDGNISVFQYTLLCTCVFYSEGETDTFVDKKKKEEEEEEERRVPSN
jgi:hypothetical protein